MKGLPFPKDFKRNQKQRIKRLQGRGFERNESPSVHEEVLVNRLEDIIRGEVSRTSLPEWHKDKIIRFIDVGILSKDPMILFSEFFEYLPISFGRFSSCNWPNPKRHDSS